MHFGPEHHHRQGLPGALVLVRLRGLPRSHQGDLSTLPDLQLGDQVLSLEHENVQVRMSSA